MRRRVLITGLGVVSSVGVGADAFWRGITTGATGFSPAPPEIERLGAKVVATVKDFSGAAYLKNERNARILNRTFELLVGAGALAAADAALNATPIPPHRLGVIVGVGPIDQYTDDLLAAVKAATTNGGVDLAPPSAAAQHRRGSSLDRTQSDGTEPDAGQRSCHRTSGDC